MWSEWDHPGVVPNFSHPKSLTAVIYRLLVGHICKLIRSRQRSPVYSSNWCYPLTDKIFTRFACTTGHIHWWVWFITFCDSSPHGSSESHVVLKVLKRAIYWAANAVFLLSTQFNHSLSVHLIFSLSANFSSHFYTLLPSLLVALTLLFYLRLESY